GFCAGSRSLIGHTAKSACTKSIRGLAEGVDLRGEARDRTGSGLRGDCALGGRLVESDGCRLESGGRGGLVLRMKSRANALHERADGALDRAVASGFYDALAVALLCGGMIGHGLYP